MGIGLALVQQLVNLHGGSVIAESEGPGKGTRFTVRLPAQSQNGETIHDAANENAQKLTGAVVLAVDDHEDTANMIQLQLEALGATVFAATSGREAMDIARKNHLDAVVTDISMPEMDGFDLLRQLRRLPGKENVPMVAVTGLGQPEDVRRALNEGFQGHLTKPLEITALVELVRRLAS